MALGLSSRIIWSQSSVTMQQIHLRNSQKSCDSKPRIGTALSRRKGNMHDLSYPSQVRRVWKSVTQQGSGDSQQRAWTTSSVALEYKNEGSIGDQEVHTPFPADEPVNETDRVTTIPVDEPVVATVHVTTKANTISPPVHQISNGRRQGNGLQWILGPLAIMVTGALPALWLPSPLLFSGSAIAGLLSLTGLDATFNMGATAFLVMAHSCARNATVDSSAFRSNSPLRYKVWSFLANLVGLVTPIALVMASVTGVLELRPSVHILPAVALLGPYTLLLLVQWMAEVLVWQWQSPVWPVLPLLYQAYRVLQLTRGVELGAALDAPGWLVQLVKGLVAWWVFVLGMQIMWVAWLVGNSQTRPRPFTN